MQAAQDQDKLLAVQGAKAESLTVWINALVEGAGGHIIDNPEAPADEVELGLDTDAGRAAAQIIGDIGTSGVGGAGLPSEDEPASLTVFQGDRGSFMVNWPFVWSSTQGAVEAGSLDQSLLDDIGWALYPQTVEGSDARPPYGGISLGIGAFGKHTDLAYEAAQCIVSPDNQAEYFVTNGNPAASIEAYEDPDVQKAFPMYDVIRDSLDQAAPRPQTPFYNEVSTGLQQPWHPPAAVTPDPTRVHRLHHRRPARGAPPVNAQPGPAAEPPTHGRHAAPSPTEDRPTDRAPRDDARRGAPAAEARAARSDRARAEARLGWYL